MKNRRNWLIGLALAAGTVLLVFQGGNSSQLPFVEDAAATMPPTMEMCAFVWAAHDAPELTETLNKQVQELDSAASASARYFGEDCVYADGRSTFGVMETDFYITLLTDNVNDPESFGNWIADSMPLVLSLPAAEIQGRFGFVEYVFVASNSETVTVRVPADTFIEQTDGKRGAELFGLYLP